MIKKMLLSLPLLCIFSFTLFSNPELNPEQTLDKLLGLFRSYNISSIPATLDEATYTKLEQKIKRKRRITFDIGSVYISNGSGTYVLKSGLSEKKLKTIINVFHQVNYRVLTEKQKVENEALKVEIEKIFHFPSLIEGALTDQWANLTQAQRDNIYTKFKTLIELFAYPQARYFYSNSENNFDKVELTDDLARIHSTNYNNDKDIDITLTYIFKKMNGSWVLVDMEMNEHSLIEAYKNQINRVVSKKGIGGLIAILDDKYDEFTGKK